MWRKPVTGLLNLILPPRCIACSAFTEANGVLCAQCWKQLDFITDPQCIACGFPFLSHLGATPEANLCGACMSRKPLYDHARSALRYNEHSAPLIIGFKYSDRTHMAGILAGWMAQAGAELLRGADALVPVPLHRFRLISRRYNQAALLSYAISKQVHVPVIPDMIVRKKNTVPQASLTRKQRLKNVKSAFMLSPKFGRRLKSRIAGRHIVLIDDVMTTGATLAACTKVLKKGGAARVDVLTVARTVIGD